jgi:hypothetical protein
MQSAAASHVHELLGTLILLVGQSVTAPVGSVGSFELSRVRDEPEFSSTPIPTSTTVDTFSIVITSKTHLLSCELLLLNVRSVFQMLSTIIMLTIALFLSDKSLESTKLIVPLCRIRFMASIVLLHPMVVLIDYL